MLEPNENEFAKYLEDKLMQKKFMGKYEIESIEFDYEEEIDAISLYIIKKTTASVVEVSETELEKITEKIRNAKIIIMGNLVVAESRETFIRLDLIKLEIITIQKMVENEIKIKLNKKNIVVDDLVFDFEEEDYAYSIYVSNKAGGMFDQLEMENVEAILNKLNLEVAGFHQQFTNRGTYIKGSFYAPQLHFIEDILFIYSKSLTDIEAGYEYWQKTKNSIELNKAKWALYDFMNGSLSELTEDKEFYINYFMPIQNREAGWLFYQKEGDIYFKIVKGKINIKNVSKYTPKDTLFIYYLENDILDDEIDNWTDFNDKLFDALPFVKEKAIRKIIGYSG